MTHARVAVTLAALLLIRDVAAGAPAPCLVTAAAPARAIVGEQIVLRLRVLRRPDVSAATWLDGQTFAGFRSDPLPGLSGEARVREGGAEYLVFEERHALFPVRAGSLAIPAARLQCTLHSLPGQTARAYVATRPPLEVEVVPPPERGRPPDFGGLVGSLKIEARAEPLRVSLGDSFHLEIVVEGEADLRDVPSPFDGAREVAGAEVFAARPLLRTDRGPRLRLQRVFSLQLVPRSVGVLTIPAIRIPYFDPETRRYGVARSAPIEIRVDPRGAG